MLAAVQPMFNIRRIITGGVMQKFTRAAIVLLLILVAIAIVGSQTQLYQKGYTGFGKLTEIAGIQTKQPVASEMPVIEKPVATVAGLPVTSAVMTQASPEDVKRELAEREKDREVIRNLQKETARLAASSLAQNYLLLFQAIIYFLVLLILYGLMESIKKIADTGVKTAEALRNSSEGNKGHIGHSKRFEGNKFIMRRLRGNYQKR